MTQRVKVGVIGPGLMGGPMAANLLAAGFEVRLLARNPAKVTQLVAQGATLASTARELATSSDVMISMLQDLQQLEPLLDGPDGVFAGARSSKTLVISSSVAPDDVRQLAVRAGAASDGLLRVLDAPVSGGPTGARAGTLAIMLGGATEDLEPARTVLGACGTVTYCGPLGAGEVVKACNQMMVGLEMVGLSEAALLAEDAGVEVGVMFDILSRGWGASAVLEHKRTAIEQRDYTNQGAAKFMLKDLNSALAEAAHSRRQLPVTAFTQALYADLVEAGLGDEDLAVMHRFIESLTNR